MDPKTAENRLSRFDRKKLMIPTLLFILNKIKW